MRRRTDYRCGSRGFTLVELLVSVGIFIVMTALLVAKYGNFNQSVLLTNLAYDVAITIRTAQTYGLSVKRTSAEDDFAYGYGVNFSKEAGYNKVITFFKDTSEDKRYFPDSPGDEFIKDYAIKRGAYISDICLDAGRGLKCNTSFLSVSFKRPDPAASICLSANETANAKSVATCGSYAEIILNGSDNTTRKVTVRSNGQISVIE